MTMLPEYERKYSGFGCDLVRVKVSYSRLSRPEGREWFAMSIGVEARTVAAGMLAWLVSIVASGQGCSGATCLYTILLKSRDSVGLGLHTHIRDEPFLQLLQITHLVLLGLGPAHVENVGINITGKEIAHILPRFLVVLKAAREFLLGTRNHLGLEAIEGRMLCHEYHHSLLMTACAKNCVCSHE
jgi:hypothetical protein